ncbi:MAG: hypothetical protein U1F43_23390 [Myxococcota bacterium]
MSATWKRRVGRASASPWSLSGAPLPSQRSHTSPSAATTAALTPTICARRIDASHCARAWRSTAELSPTRRATARARARSGASGAMPGHLAQRADEVRAVDEAHGAAHADVVAGAVQVGLLVGEAGAAEEAQDGRIEGVAHGDRRQAGGAPELDRDDGGAEHLPLRVAVGQVAAEGQRSEDLGEADRWHAALLPCGSEAR